MTPDMAQVVGSGQKLSDEEARRILAQVGGMMNLAGAQVTDPT